MLLFQGGRFPPTLGFLGNYQSGASALTTYTKSSADLGTPRGDRKIIVAVGGGEGTRTVSSVTVNGVSATLVKRQQSSTITAEIWIASVPAGTSGDIVVTWSGGQSHCGIAWWGATGSFSLVDSDGSTASPGTFTLDTRPGGFVVAYAGPSNTGNGTSTWTNATERFDAIVNGSTIYHSGADAVTAGSSLAITDTYAAGGTHTLVGASWG